MNAATRGLPVQPFDRRPSVMAGASSAADFVWLDADQVPEAPDSLRYRIDNLSDYRAVLPWTTVADPEAETSISIPPSVNVMTHQWTDRQWMQVMAEATMADGSVQRKLWVYELIAQVLP
jgi:hypothetical protein